MTDRTPEQRAKELFTTSIPTEFKVEYAVQVAHCAYAEKLIHQRLMHYRANENREFFTIDLQTAIKQLDKAAKEINLLFERDKIVPPKKDGESKKPNGNKTVYKNNIHTEHAYEKTKQNKSQLQLLKVDTDVMASVYFKKKAKSEHQKDAIWNSVLIRIRKKIEKNFIDNDKNLSKTNAKSRANIWVKSNYPKRPD
tara:strand:- start:6917 stop:7504 length:588 start_codon:yes stop_codon:yes gene_type:complete